MLQQEHEFAAMMRECSEAVAQLCERYNWQLQAQDLLVQRACTCLHAGETSNARRAAIYVYSHVLYLACSGIEGQLRQERGYTELHHYLYALARERYPEVAEDATQIALERVFRNCERCRKPGAFLAFALQHLRDAARSLYRDHNQTQPFVHPAEGRDNGPDALFGQDQPSPITTLLADERHTALLRLATDFLRRHPRASQQFAALWLKYIDNLDEQTISQRLGKSVKSIYVLRSRAIAKLRQDPQWIELAVEFGLTPE